MSHYTEVLNWMKKYEGKPIDEDGVYGAQCVDLVNRYAREVHGEKYSRGNGKDKALNFARDYGWKFVGPNETAQAGDVISWGTSWGGGYGHTAVVLEDKGSYIRGFDQNPNAPRIRDIRKIDVVGYARPKRYLTAPAPTQTSTASADKTHTVKSGESLWSIARLYNLTLDKIKSLNPGVSVIFSGQQINVDGSTSTAQYHTVVFGDTYWGISRKYGVTVDSLYKLNPNINASNLKVGQRVRVK